MDSIPPAPELAKSEPQCPVETMTESFFFLEGEGEGERGGGVRERW